MAGPGVDWEVTQHKMFRHWRIQAFLICFTLLLAVIVLWVHSYKWVDSYWHRREDVIEFAFISYKGAICFAVFSPIGIPSADGFRSERIDLNVMEKGLGGSRLPRASWDSASTNIRVPGDSACLTGLSRSSLRCCADCLGTGDDSTSVSAPSLSRSRFWPCYSDSSGG